MLQFWWYSSVARHIGIGGLKDKNSMKYKALKNALLLYKEIKPILIKGTFYGIDPTIHLHVAEDNGNGVILAFNLGSRNKKIDVKIDAALYNLDCNSIELLSGTNQKIEANSKFHKTNNILSLEIVIPPMTPVIAILK
jgi:hypothetical protein